MQAVEQPAGNLLRTLGIEIGPSHVSDEERIAGEYADGGVAGLEMHEDERDRIVGVAGRLDRGEANLPERELLAIRNRPGIRHAEVRAGAAPHLGSGTRRELARP